MGGDVGKLLRLFVEWTVLSTIGNIVFILYSYWRGYLK